MPVNIQLSYHSFFFLFTDGLSVVLFFFLLRFDLAFFSREILCIVRDKYAFSIQIHAHRIVFSFLLLFVKQSAYTQCMKIIP